MGGKYAKITYIYNDLAGNVDRVSGCRGKY